MDLDEFDLNALSSLGSSWPKKAFTDSRKFFDLSQTNELLFPALVLQAPKRCS